MSKGDMIARNSSDAANWLPVGSDGEVLTADSASTLGVKWDTGGGGGGSSDGWTAAGETWTYASADAPTFTFTVAADVTTKYAAGQRIKLTQTTDKFFIVTGVSTFSGGNTTITVYGGTDYTLANAAITSPYWSLTKAPFGFPLAAEKWTVEVTDTTSRTQSNPANGTWYNLGSISIVVPIGSWRVLYEVCLEHDQSNTDTATIAYSTLSTANNTESDKKFTTFIYRNGPSAAGYGMSGPVHRENPVTITSKSTRYLNAMSESGGTNIYFTNDVATCVIRAICAYL